MLTINARRYSQQQVCKIINNAKNLKSFNLNSAGCNLTPQIIEKIGQNLLLAPNHPLAILKTKIHNILQEFKLVYPENPIVSVKQNFDHLLIPADHPGRSKSDTYYVDHAHVLRTHTSAHQSEVLMNSDDRAILLAADCYRRDEIDPTHYPVFHQMEGIYTWNEFQLIGYKNLEGKKSLPLIIPESNPIQRKHSKDDALLVALHLRYTLENLMRKLIEDDSLQIRWIDAYFPFTSPSWEMEIYYNNQWLEVLGCGVIQQEILDSCGKTDRIGWAFGLGLERIAMVLFDIPDIRLFWSKDKRFLNQFADNQITKFHPFSKYPVCYKDLSFWINTDKKITDTDFAEIVRNEAGDLAETVKLVYSGLIID